MSDTIAALSTPTGESAVALVRLSGGECPRLAREIFGRNEIPPRAAHFGRYKNIAGNILDEAVFTLFAAPNSYTGEDMLEISTHGNPFIVQNILEDLFARGCRAAEPGEFTRRAFMNDKMDLSQAEAVSLLISARSGRSLKAAQKQLSGELGARIDGFSEELVSISALTEAYIDFPDEDLPPEDKENIANTAKKLVGEIQRLIDTSKYSPLVHQGINMVIAGAPNAGKSSLLNRLLGQNRAIVSPVAGTTRDFIKEKIILGPHAVNITDTAGIHKAGSDIEALGIEKAVERIEACDICLLALDTSDALPDLPEYAMKNLAPQNTILVLNKCDLPGSDAAKFREKFKGFAAVEISCADGAGIPELREEIVRLIETHHIQASADDILVSTRHVQALERAKAGIQCAAEKIADNLPSELAASDLRDALDALGEIVGKTDNEAVLDKIFSTFCIGK